MYDWPEVRDATDAWWSGIARHAGLGCPLTRENDYAGLWHRGDLVFSQTCGYPFTHDFGGSLKLLGTPNYQADGCDGADYASFVFAREKPARLSDLAGTVAAVNSPDSMSGMLALKLVFAPLARAGRFFRGAVKTGSHIASLAAVRDGAADVCAVDAVCVALARQYRPDYLDGLVEIARSPRVPGLPYVTSARTDAAMQERLRDALGGAIADPSLAACRAALFISGLSPLTANDYQVITDLERQCEARGGLDLI